MFITILEVLTDQSETKVLKLKFYLTLINTSNISDFSEIRVTDRQNSQETQPDITPT